MGIFCAIAHKHPKARRINPSAPRIDLDSGTRLPFEVTQVRNRPVVQNFVISIADDAVCHSSFGLDPQLVEVGSNPALAIL
jgi:hypothetical protein